MKKRDGKVDTVYADKMSRVVDFVFDENVAAVFPDMIRRSVPGYETLIALLGVIAERHLRAGDTVYDLGCSLGAALLSVHARMPDAHFIGVDNSAAMLERCRENLRGVMDDRQFELLNCDVVECEINNAGMVMLNFTVQFIAPGARLALLKKIYDGLTTGGVLVLSEKIAFADADEENLHQSLHEQFKTANGYSALEIAQKRAALENVLVAESADTHIARLREAGFAHVSQWFRAFNFCAFIAVK